MTAALGFINAIQKNLITIPRSDQSIQKKIIDVPYISQQGTLATGCELVSSMMILKYYGYDVTADEIIRRTPQSDLTQSNNGLTGAHPSEAFIGDPHSPNGFGCYAPVIASVMNSFFERDGTKKAVDVTGTDLESLIHNYIEHDTPVIIWATSNMKQPRAGKSWTIENTGDTFQWISGEHCLVLVGYDQDSYYFNDPYESNGLIAFEKGIVEDRFQTLGQQAVVVSS
ncbi:C39 family peptidase [Caproiciproducens sp. NJN-50]|uniref:C39 family peptidase n=1 Tax=Caproiciproducens sp. NJN-50 TaxID=2507162 RepID=UPI0013E8C996|nr:C39 family peptidase [Caproiciproducens sp. NJN-50]